MTASPCSFSKKNDSIMPLDQNPHQIVTRFGCVGFSIYACGVSPPQMRQFCLFTYPPKSKWASSENMIIFAKIDIFCKSITGPLPSSIQAYTQPYSFGGTIKQFFCEIGHELSVTIHEIVEKKNVRWRTLYFVAINQSKQNLNGYLTINTSNTKYVRKLVNLDCHQKK